MNKDLVNNRNLFVAEYINKIMSEHSKNIYSSDTVNPGIFYDPDKLKIYIALSDNTHIFYDILNLIAPEDIINDEERYFDLIAASRALEKWWSTEFYLNKTLMFLPFLKNIDSKMVNLAFDLQAKTRNMGIGGIIVPEVINVNVDTFKDLKNIVTTSNLKVGGYVGNDFGAYDKKGRLKRRADANVGKKYTYDVYNTLSIFFLRSISAIPLFSGSFEDGTGLYSSVLKRLKILLAPDSILTVAFKLIYSAFFNNSYIKTSLKKANDFLDKVFSRNLGDVRKVKFKGDIDLNESSIEALKNALSVLPKITDSISYYPFVYIDDVVLDKYPEMIEGLIKIYSSMPIKKIYERMGQRLNIAIVSKKRNLVMFLGKRKMSKLDSKTPDIPEYILADVEVDKRLKTPIYGGFIMTYKDMISIYKHTISSESDYTKIVSMFEKKGDNIKDAVVAKSLKAFLKKK